MNFDMNSCWSRAVELLQSNFQLLIVIAGMFLLLPTMAIYMLVPDFQMLADPTIDRSVVEERIGEIVGPLLLASLFSLLFQFAGQAAMIALMGDDRPTVGQALSSGFKAVPSLFAVMIGFVLLLMIGGLLITVPISLLAGVLMYMQWPASGELAIGILIGVKLIIDGIELIGVATAAKALVD